MDYIKAFSAAYPAPSSVNSQEIYEQFHFSAADIRIIEERRLHPNDGLGQRDENRITLLQNKLKDNQFIYIGKSGSWPGEYVARAQEYLWWLTGFSGSAGHCLIGKNTAILFSDSRYLIQAPQQAPHMIFFDTAKKTPLQWLDENTHENHEILIYGWITPVCFYQELKEKTSANITILDDFSILEELWDNRLPLPYSPIWEHELSYAGKSAEEKIADYTQILKESKLDAYLITEPENIAWLLNIRSADIEHTPIALSFAIVWQNGQVDWYIDERRLLRKLKDKLTPFVCLRSPDDLKNRDLSSYTIGYNAATTIVSLYNLLSAQSVDREDPCLLPKACKNSIEQKGMKDVHLLDAVAMVRFLHWLEQEVPQGHVSEISAAEKLNFLRFENKACISLSFETISASGPNAALPHYHASTENSRPLSIDEIYLIDSGGQYAAGTTDITRTIKIGTASSEEKKAFTLVLKGVIALFMQKFPKQTKGKDIDALARKPLNDNGMDFGHGTGHGVGCYLGVHEGPQSLSKRDAHTPLVKGMVCSIEPGYYQEGHFGIRIENLAIIQSLEETFFFENITYCPIDTRLIDIKLLSLEEKDWLNHYHREVYDILSPILQDYSDVKNWLKQATKEI